MSPREVLNELKWRDDRNLVIAKIFYIHRGAPGDQKEISGADIEELDNSFFSTSGSMIPYHRIFRIEYEGRVLFKRR